LEGRPWHCRDESYFSRRPDKDPSPTSAPAEPSTAPSNKIGALSENCAAEIAAQADKVITNMSVIVALEDEHPNSLSDTPQPPLRVSRAKFLDAFASR